MTSMAAEEASYHSVMERELQLKFAEVAFKNSQELVRFIDQKASLMITAVGVLTTALGALLIRALNASADELWQIALRGVVSAVVLIYLLMAFLVIAAATKVLTSASKPRHTESRALGLLFPLTLLARVQGNEDIYFERLASASTDQLLQDYANQIVEIAHIYQAKQNQLNIALRRFRWLSILWIVTILLLAVVTTIMT